MTIKTTCGYPLDNGNPCKRLSTGYCFGHKDKKPVKKIINEEREQVSVTTEKPIVYNRLEKIKNWLTSIGR